VKSYFSQAVIRPNDTLRALPPCSCVRVVSVSGTVKIQFDGGDPITLVAGDRYKSDWPTKFEKIQITAEAGATATIVYGDGDTGSGGAAIGGTVQDATGNPEGVLDASAGQWAYDSDASALYINPATSGTAGWVQII